MGMFPNLARAVRITCLATLATTAFELAKLSAFPSIAIRESQLSTILFIAASAFVVSQAFVRKEAKSRAYLCAERQRSEALLSRSEATLRSQVRNAPYGIYRSTPDGTILSGNPAVCKILGLSSEAELLSINLQDAYLDPQNRSPLAESLLKQGDLRDIECAWKRQDGTPITVRLSAHKQIGESGEIIFQGFVEDITESRKAESEMRRLNRALSTLSKCNDILVHADNETELLNLVSNILVEIGGYRLAWVGYSEQNERKSVRVMAKAGRDEGYLQEVRISWGDDKYGAGPVGTAIRTGEVCVLRDILENPRFSAWRDQAGLRGYASVTALPLRDSDKVIGALAIYSTESDAFDEQEVNLLRDLARNLSYGIVSLRNTIERQRSENALRTSEGRYRMLYDHNFVAVFHSAVEGFMLGCNEAMCQMLGYSLEEMLSIDLRSLYFNPVDREVGRKQLFERGRLANYQIDLRRKDGSAVTVLANLNLLHESPGRAPIICGVLLDVTEVRKLQAQLLQSQKMEAIGKLTGGIAHDFNNILMIINSYSELVLGKVDDQSSLRRPVEQIRSAGDRAAALTRQLLAFSRKQALEPVVLNLNSLISSLDDMLRRLIGEDVNLEVSSTSELWLTKADPNQIEQVIFNLALNARDAMPKGGKLALRTANVELDEDTARAFPGMVPGQYVKLTISDTGSGIPSDIQPRIFEPFFTTKDPGRGTGLGLSTVYGIVKQSGGYIAVESEVNKGSEFCVYLQRCTEPETHEREMLLAASPAAGTTLLLVEDEDPTREALAEYLGQNGFRVIAASSAQEALRKCDRAHTPNIDVLLTDVVMPGMSGTDLAARFQANYPGAKIVFMSGYTDDVLDRSGVQGRNVTLLMKPFRLADLVGKLKDILATPTRA